MKSYLVFSMLTLAACSGSKQESNEDRLPASIVNNPYSASGVDTGAASVKPTMVFADTLHNFGTMHEGEAAVYEFTFANTGRTPLIISSASGSCGCTVTEYPGEPIKPGEAASLKVTFNSVGKEGHQEKAVTIQTNTVRNIHMLYITAEVEKKK